MRVWSWVVCVLCVALPSSTTAAFSGTRAAVLKGDTSQLSGRGRTSGTASPPAPALSPQPRVLPGRSQQPPHRDLSPGVLPPGLQACHFPCLEPSVAPKYPEFSLPAGLYHSAQPFPSSTPAPGVLSLEFRGFQSEAFLLPEERVPDGHRVSWKNCPFPLDLYVPMAWKSGPNMQWLLSL